MLNPKRHRTILARFYRAPSPAVFETGGFTLIELLVAMAVASIMLAAMVSLFATLDRSYTSQNVAANVQQVARAGVDFMAQSIRMAGLDPKRTGKFGITDASGDLIRFTADTDLSGGVPGADETIEYSVSSGELQFNGMALVENVTDLSFVYLAADDSPLAPPVADLAAIRTVQIALTVREPAGRGEMVARTYATEVRCRNLGL